MLAPVRAHGDSCAPFLRSWGLVLAQWIPAFVTELSEAESAAALASMPGRARSQMDRLSKAEGDDKPRRLKYRITGIASTEHRDRQGDIIRQSGLDFGPFLKNGYINDDHGKGADAIIGYPTSVKPITLRGESNKPVAATAIEGYLFDVPRAANLAKLARSMEGTERQMGFSVEGPAPKRNPSDPTEITDAVVTHVALTPWPVNPHALAYVEGMAQLAKSFKRAMTAGDGVATPGAEVPGDVSPLVVQDLQGAPRAKRRKVKVPLSEAVKMVRRALKSSPNDPAGVEPAEGEKRMNARDFLKGKLKDMSEAEAMKFAKQAGYSKGDYEDMDDDEDDADVEIEIEKSGRDSGAEKISIDALKNLLGALAARGDGPDMPVPNFAKSEQALGGLAKSDANSADVALAKSLLADAKDAYNAAAEIYDDLRSTLKEVVEAQCTTGVILAKSHRGMTDRIKALEDVIGQAVGRTAPPRAVVSAVPAARFPDDVAPGGSLAKSGAGAPTGAPLGNITPAELRDRLTKGMRDAHAKGDASTHEALGLLIGRMENGVTQFSDADRALVLKCLA